MYRLRTNDVELRNEVVDEVLTYILVEWVRTFSMEQLVIFPRFQGVLSVKVIFINRWNKSYPDVTQLS